MKLDSLLLNKALFTTQEAAQCFSSEKSMQVAIKNSIDAGRAMRVKNGLYATVNSLTGGTFANRFEIASAMADLAYVGYHSALEYHGLSNQVFSTMYVITKTAYRPIDFDGIEYRFVSAPVSYGVMTVQQNAEIHVTDLERTTLDCINRIDLAGGLEELTSALSGILFLDESKLLMYLEEYNKKLLYKKTGYLLQHLKNKGLSDSFFEVCQKKMSRRVDSVVENKKIKSHLNNKWQIIVPDKPLNIEN